LKLLVTGANGYIGRRLIPLLLEQGHEVVALVRSARRFPLCDPRIEVVEGDLLDGELTLSGQVDAAYYLVHSLTKSNFERLEETAARNFNRLADSLGAGQVIYLSGVGSSRSPHMRSRQRVEEVLALGSAPVTVVRAAIIIGAGSASFEILRDLVEKLPVMVAPRWIMSLCQPIAIDDVVFYLSALLGKKEAYGRRFDIGGPHQMTYKEMMLEFAAVRGLHRAIFTVPVLTPHLSSYWLLFVTSTNYQIARNLVESLRGDAVCEESSIDEILPHQCMTYQEAIGRAFHRIEQNCVVSSWTDALHRGRFDCIEVPHEGCYSKRVEVPLTDRKSAIERVWSIGGQRGWYAWDLAWKVRGAIDKLFGGVGLRRGRRDPVDLHPGDALDFWRVLLADKEEGHLLLHAEMRLPGEAWLEFRVGENSLEQTAVYRPRGLWGRIYWWMLVPVHHFLFTSMAKRLIGD